MFCLILALLTETHIRRANWIIEIVQAIKLLEEYQLTKVYTEFLIKSRVWLVENDKSPFFFRMKDIFSYSNMNITNILLHVFFVEKL